MNYRIKVLRGLDRGNFAIIITRGQVDLAGFERILDEVIDSTRTLLDCKVLLDFQDSTLEFLPSDVANFLVRFDFEKWPHSNKIALVSSPEMQQFGQLACLADGLVRMKLEVGSFYNTRDAIDWLAGIRSA
jgi:hypothetical protein